MVAIPSNVSFHLFLQLRCLSTQCLEHVIDQGRGLIGIQSAAANPLLGHTPEALCDQSGGPKAAEQQLLKGIAGVHQNLLAWLQDDPGGD